ncbi:MAG: alpha/beta fold hydrolase [Blastocatellia bacterium]|jgi:pimeloyl-ACP methyl ester carboxylesterase
MPSRNRRIVLSALVILGGLTFAGLEGSAMEEKAPGREKPQAPFEERVQHRYAENKGVKIHYAALGEPSAPLVVMIHGFPDFWYTWRHQMEALSKEYYTVALDQRGYNLSDRPKGGEEYQMSKLVEDVRAVIRACGRERAIVVGHDWGGAVAWSLAMISPESVERLIILNLPHPRGLARELVRNPQQQKNSQYARNFQRPEAHLSLKAEQLAAWVTDPAAKARYIEAFQRSDFEAMLHYYKQNYPREPYTEPTGPVIKVKAPVLMIHGLQDWALLPGGLNDTWEWLEQDLTLVTVPGAGHFVQQDAAETVSRTIRMWLNR